MNKIKSYRQADSESEIEIVKNLSYEIKLHTELKLD